MTGEQAAGAGVSGRLRLVIQMGRGRDADGFLQQVEGPIQIAGLPRTKEGGFISKLAFLRGVYPGANPKVAEGGPVGHETGLSPLLPRLRGGDKDGVGIMGGIIGGGEGVQWAFRGSRASGAVACRTPWKFSQRLGSDRQEGRRRGGARLRCETTT